MELSKYVSHITIRMEFAMRILQRRYSYRTAAAVGSLSVT